MTDRDVNPDNPHWLDGTREALRPPPHLSLSEWADKHYYLSPESGADLGRWRTLPYQREPMDCVTDPAVERITWWKSARIGATLSIVTAPVGYHIHHDPCPVLVAEPTEGDAESYSKQGLAPMLRDCPVLDGIIRERRGKSAAQTMLEKTYPGGVLNIVGAHSARGFRRTSKRVVIFDEIDGYPPTAGAEGDQIKLGIKRTEYYANRKIIAVSTPTTDDASRIKPMFYLGDQRRYHVPCPQCGHTDYLVFSKHKDGGHWMQWPGGEPENAYFVCSGNGCAIEHKDKHAMVTAGAWIAAAPFRGHASFHLWTAYSFAPNATWGQIAQEFADAKNDPEALKTFVNTTLGETWQERGEAPDYEKLYSRRETYGIGTVPAGVHFLTEGIDVQIDRFEYEVVGWGLDKQSWSIERGIIMGEPDAHGNHVKTAATWAKLDQHLNRTYPGEDGREYHVAKTAIDSGNETQAVYNWARKKPMSRVIAIKGSGTERSLVGLPSPVDVMASGKRHQRAYKVWPVGVNIAKTELYGWLRLPIVPDGEPHPEGYCHFPEHGVEYFKQLTAEHLVPVKKRSGHVKREWRVLPGRENHGLDCRVYARAAASVQGLDRHIPRDDDAPPPTKPAPQASAEDPQHREPAPARKKRAKKDNWITSGRGSGDFLRGRRR